AAPFRTPCSCGSPRPPPRSGSRTSASWPAAPARPGSWRDRRCGTFVAVPSRCLAPDRSRPGRRGFRGVRARLVHLRHGAWHRTGPPEPVARTDVSAVAAVRARALAVPAWFWLAGIVVVSAAIRIAIGHRMVAPWIMIDEVVYSELAKSFAAHVSFDVRG